MTTFFWIVLSTFFISLISFVGVLILFLKERLLNKILFFLVAFSAGALIGGAFLHLIPEAIEKTKEGSIFRIFLYLIFGFCLFFVLEHFIKWHHHHATRHPDIMPFSYLILVSDGLHNFIDGLIIAGSFLVNPAMGLVTSLAVALHEIPQEIGDFAVLIYGGIKKKRALFLNFASATLAILGGLVGFFLLRGMGEGTLLLLPFTAGGFIYISASDLIPQVKGTKEFQKSVIYFLVFLTGIVIMALMKTYV
jgi:zinc and cadmium transporter